MSAMRRRKAIPDVADSCKKRYEEEYKQKVKLIERRANEELDRLRDVEDRRLQNNYQIKMAKNLDALDECENERKVLKEQLKEDEIALKAYQRLLLQQPESKKQELLQQASRRLQVTRIQSEIATAQKVIRAMKKLDNYEEIEKQEKKIKRLKKQLLMMRPVQENEEIIEEEIEILENEFNYLDVNADRQKKERETARNKRKKRKPLKL